MSLDLSTKFRKLFKRKCGERKSEACRRLRHGRGIKITGTRVFPLCDTSERQGWLVRPVCALGWPITIGSCCCVQYCCVQYAQARTSERVLFSHWITTVVEKDSWFLGSIGVPKGLIVPPTATRIDTQRTPFKDRVCSNPGGHPPV